MTVFCIKLADIPMEIHARFDSTRDFCKDYLTEEAPFFSITMTQENIEEMRLRDAKTAALEGRTPGTHSDSYLETLALACVVFRKLISYRILLCHGAVMALDGKAYLFTAKSGTGKTTHCRLWLKNIPGCHILNGDKPLLRFDSDGVFVCGSPWQGKEHYGVNESLPLAGICLLRRDATNHIERVTVQDCLGDLIGQLHIPDSNQILAVLSMLPELDAVKIFRLGCNMEDEAALVSYQVMTKTP